MPQTFTLVHLSDLHFSHGSLRLGDHSHSIERLQAIDNVLQQQEYDRLIVSGDLSNRGDLESLNQAKEWLFATFGIGNDERTGLRLPPDKAILVPGNHDAYNCESPNGSVLQHRQRALDHYNTIFNRHTFESKNEFCRYYWVPKGSEAIFIVAVDSCFLGDPTMEKTVPEIRNQLISIFSKPARGKMSCDQSQHVLGWFDQGMRGKLPVDMEGEELISSNSFAKSFKILVMHHYIFEPPEYKNSLSLRLNHRNIVFKNLAMADFDLMLCGHKHVAAFMPEPYGKYFTDRRSRSRYMLNLFRRLIRIQSLPLQISDDKGTRISRALGNLINLFLSRIPREPNETEPAYEERLVKALQSLLVNQRSWKEVLSEFGGISPSDDVFDIEQAELKEMAQKIAGHFGIRERRELAKVAGEISKIISRLQSRPFVQGMCGSSAKKCSGNDKRRSFSIYKITLEDGHGKVVQQEYAWDAGANGFAAPFQRQQEFLANRRLPF